MHSDWSDGGDTIRTMAEKARALGHEYFALTDHSPRLKIANGLTAERLREQLDVVAELNEELTPFRILTGVEVDILEDGALDDSEELLARVDVVVGERALEVAHGVGADDAPDGRRDREPARRRARSLHRSACSIGRGRPQSEFDADVVIEACRVFDTALEINCRPERLDPPEEMLRKAVDAGVKIAISTDAHADRPTRVAAVRHRPRRRVRRDGRAGRQRVERRRAARVVRVRTRR